MSSGSHRATTALVACLALSLVASACASEPTSEVASPPTGNPSVASSPTPGQGSAAGDGQDGGTTPEPAPIPEILDFEAPLVGGGTLAGAELAGAPVAVWFWAPW